MTANHYGLQAQHVSPAAFDNAQRNIIRQQIIAERDQAARAELEAEVTRRIELARGRQGKPAEKPVQAPRVIAIVGEVQTYRALKR